MRPCHTLSSHATDTTPVPGDVASLRRPAPPAPAVRFGHAYRTAFAEICGGQQVVGSVGRGAGGGRARRRREVSRRVDALSVLVAELGEGVVRREGEEGGGGRMWRKVGGNLQHVVVVLELALGDLFNGEGRRDAHRREHLRCSRRERNRGGRCSGRSWRAAPFAGSSSSSSAPRGTWPTRPPAAAVTRTSRLRASNTLEMVHKPRVGTFLRGTLPGCSASSSLRQATPSQQCSTCSWRGRACVCETLRVVEV
jgi:hypothetical protein